MNTIVNLRISHLSRLRAVIGLLILTALALSVLAGAAEAAVTLDVQPSGGTYNSIQDAIYAAPLTTDTVVIRVAEGTYHENIDIDDAMNLTIQGGWNSAFTSRDTNRATVAHGDSNGSEIDIYNSTATIDGLTVTRGNDNDGGGIDAGDSNLTLRNTKVVRNEADDQGGGIYSRNTNLVIENSEVAHNMTWDNDGDYQGGGLYVDGGSLTIRDSSIHDNGTATDSYSSDGDGGGIYLEGTIATIDRSRIVNNTSFDGNGGGIYASYADLSLTNTLVAGNAAMGYDGGGLYYYQYDNGNVLNIQNSTFANNTAEGEILGSGGGAYIDSYSAGTVTVKNSVLWGNLDGSGAPGFAANDLHFGSTPDSLAVATSDIGVAVGFVPPAGNISADPLYVNPSAGDYRLMIGSPAIDTGNAVGAPATDIDGVLRPQWAGFDMGAFENHAPSAALATPYISSNARRLPNFDVSWSGVDPSGSASGLLYEVWCKVGATGKWHRWLDWTTYTKRRFKGLVGKTYYFKVKAKDAEGNVGAFSSEQMTLVPFDGLRGNYIISRSGFYLKNWNKTSKSSYRRTLRSSMVKGEQITYRYKKTNQINVIATLGRGHGKFKVVVDGVNKGKVDTKASTTKNRQVVFTANFASFGTHKIQLVNLGTKGRPTIEIDGIAVRR